MIRIRDAGQDADSDRYFLVMALAERSLQEEVADHGPIDEARAVDVLHAIALGLSEVRSLVHRDLKPGNVLLHDQKWKIADFGIARFVEESTSLNTLKGFLTPQYAAPEQWALERSTSATDVYALGCIAHFLLTGNPPFPGPAREDYRNQHVSEKAPDLNGVTPRLQSLISMMLRKSPETRPSLDRVVEILETLGHESKQDNQGNGYEALAAAGAEAAEQSARKEAQRLTEQTREEKRQELHKLSVQSLRDIVGILESRIENVAPTLNTSGRLEHVLTMYLGSARLEIRPVLGGGLVPLSAFENSGWDVISGFIIEVGQETPRPYVWGANLWYTNRGEGQNYRWWEVLYFAPTMAQRPKHQPFAVDDWSLADRAASPNMSEIDFAADPRPVDDEDLESFCERWANLLAQAYQGKLQTPRKLPLS